MGKYEDEEESLEGDANKASFRSITLSSPNQLNIRTKQAKESLEIKSLASIMLRNDVILKTIFRSFQKNCAQAFKSFFNLTTKKNQSSLVVSKVREYLIKNFGYEDKALKTVFINTI